MKKMKLQSLSLLVLASVLSLGSFAGAMGRNPDKDESESTYSTESSTAATTNDTQGTVPADQGGTGSDATGSGATGSDTGAGSGQ